MEGASPARLYATLIGGALLLGGIIGFFYNASYAARRYALGLGVAYLLVCFLGFIHFGGGGTDSILKLIPVNTEDNYLHLILGVLGVAAGLATPRREGAAAAKRAAA